MENVTYINFKTYTVGRQGWFGIGFGTENYISNTSILMLYSYINSTIFQLLNHSNIAPFVSNDTVLDLTIDDSITPKIDNYKGFFFNIPYNIAKNYKYLFYAYTHLSITISYLLWG